MKKGEKMSQEQKAKVSANRKGKAIGNTNGFVKGQVSTFKGKKHTEEAKQKNREKHLGKSAWNKGIEYFQIKGEKNPNWNGGISKINKTERQLAMETVGYKLWRSSVFERDEFTCVECKIRGGKLEADHIKPWRDYPELRYELSNGRTLCKPCHLKSGWSLFKEDNPMKLLASGSTV